jgi:hypothetical protein
MHTIYIHIDEKLDEGGMRSLQQDLQGMNHVTDVEISNKTPHDILVEFEEDHITPMQILQEFGRRGIHADIMTG